MPFTYLYLTTTPNDNTAHEIQFYSDITSGTVLCIFLTHVFLSSRYNSDWISGNSPISGTWAPENTSDFLSLRMGLSVEGKYQEKGNIPQDSILHFSMQKVIQSVPYHLSR